MSLQIEVEKNPDRSENWAFPLLVENVATGGQVLAISGRQDCSYLFCGYSFNSKYFAEDFEISKYMPSDARLIIENKKAYK